MEKEILEQLQEIKQLTLLGTKTALNMNDLSLLTGLSKSHIYKMVMNKRIPYYKSEGGKFTYFEKSEIEKWLLHYRVKTTDEVENEAANYIITKRERGQR